MPATSVAQINFGPDALQKALDAIAGIPAGKKGHLDVGATAKGGMIEYGQKFGSIWEVGAWGGVEWSGLYSAGVRLRATW
jgi:hypothetical protein